MQIKETIENDLAVLAMKGAFLSEPEAFKLRQQFYKLVENKIQHVILDLHEVNYINSLGLGALISALTTMRKAEGDIRLVGINSKVINLFVITHLVKVFDIFDTLEEARASYRAQ